jgi:hypothetical protein
MSLRYFRRFCRIVGIDIQYGVQILCREKIHIQYNINIERNEDCFKFELDAKRFCSKQMALS